MQRLVKAGMPRTIPLLERFPALISIPRAELCALPSPVKRLARVGEPGELWIKRDDLNAPVCGGNKVRSLEFLLGGLTPGDTVVTVGGAGSTHVLSTAIHAARIGVETTAIRWRHDMNPIAEQISEKTSEMILRPTVRGSTLLALIQARYRAGGRRARYIPIGGAVPLGILGHVNAALELASQIERGEMPLPESVVLPLGSGGTVAGLLLGFAIAGLPTTVVGARVGPRAFVNRARAMSLARRTSRLIERATGERLPGVDSARFRIVHHVYGGAYGRPLGRAAVQAGKLRDAEGIQLDDTYSAKAWVAAADEIPTAKGPVLFWLTFDARCLTN